MRSYTLKRFQLRSQDRLYNKRKNDIDSDSTSTSGIGKQSARQSTDSIKEVLLVSRKYTANSPQALELNKAITYLIAKDAQPFSVFEKPGFKRMISKLNQRYQLPSRKHFVKHEIPQLYSQIKENTVVPKLSEAKHFAVTSGPVLHMFHL